MEVYLVRHGPAEARDPVRWPDDEDRPLSSNGIDQTRDAARGLAELETGIRRIVSSPAERARATAEIVRKSLDGVKSVETWEELAPDSPAGPVLARIAEEGKRADGAALFGHEPIMSELIGLALTGEAVSVVHFARAGAARIAFDRAVAPGAGRLDWLLTRRQLSEIGR